MRITPDELESQFSLPTAATRLDFLSRRDSVGTALNTVHEDDEDNWLSMPDADTSLDVYEALELLALGEVIARKAHDSQLVGIRAALRGGSTWEQVAEALGVTPQQAWDGFHDSIARQLEAAAADSARETGGGTAGRLTARELTAGELTAGRVSGPRRPSRRPPGR